LKMKLQIISRGFFPLPSRMELSLVQSWSRPIVGWSNIQKLDSLLSNRRSCSRIRSRFATPPGDPRGIPKFLIAVFHPNFSRILLLGRLEGFGARRRKRVSKALSKSNFVMAENFDEFLADFCSNITDDDIIAAVDCNNIGLQDIFLDADYPKDLPYGAVTDNSIVENMINVTMDKSDIKDTTENVIDSNDNDFVDKLVATTVDRLLGSPEDSSSVNWDLSCTTDASPAACVVTVAPVGLNFQSSTAATFELISTSPTFATPILEPSPTTNASPVDSYSVSWDLSRAIDAVAQAPVSPNCQSSTAASLELIPTSPTFATAFATLESTPTTNVGSNYAENFATAFPSQVYSAPASEKAGSEVFCSPDYAAAIPQVTEVYATEETGSVTQILTTSVPPTDHGTEIASHPANAPQNSKKSRKRTYANMDRVRELNAKACKKYRASAARKKAELDEELVRLQAVNKTLNQRLDTLRQEVNKCQNALIQHFILKKMQ